MIDISDKESVRREATATGFVKLGAKSISAIKQKRVKKGDVEEVSAVAGIMGAKATPQLIPHCHQIPLESVLPEIYVEDDGIRVKCTVKTSYKTGVEMEALACVNSMLLTVWDMVKYLEKDKQGQYRNTEISKVRVVEKIKGKRSKDGSQRRK